MTLQEIAKLAKVSTTTVHRVFSGKTDVHPDTFRKITEIAKEYGYEPSRYRKQSADINQYSNIKSGVISLLLSGLPSEFLQLPQNLKVISLLESILSKNNLTLSFIQDTEKNKINSAVSSGKTDGFIVMGDVPRHLRELLCSFPSVGIFGSNFYDEPRIDWILPDYQARARIGVNYFIGKGLKRVAYLNPIPSHSGLEEVEIEFNHYAKRVNMVPVPIGAADPLHLNMYRKEKGRAIVGKLIDNMLQLPAGDRPEGIFVANDEVAMDVYSELLMHGIRIGREIIVLSSDNIDVFLDRLSPRPASIDLNYLDIVEAAVDRLLKRIENPLINQGVRILIPPKLVESQKHNKN